MSKRAVIYTRVSRDDTGEGQSNQRQEEVCRKLADLRGYEVVGVEPDISISAYSGKDRPAWERVLGMIERGEIDAVLAWHMDRMTRSMLDLERLILLADEHGVGIVTATGDIDLTTDVGRMVARILAAVARAEVERKSARQRLANESRARQGKPWPSGFRAFGYTHDGTIVEDEAALVRQAVEDVLKVPDGKPLKQVAREWTAAGFEPPRAKRRNVEGWTHRSVKSILLNPRNAGLATYRGEVVGKGQWDPLYSETTLTMLSAHLRDPSRLTRQNGSNGRRPENLLTGIATCSTCGETVHARSSDGRPIYSCPSYHLSIVREATDDLVRSGFWATVATVMPGSVMPLEGHSTTLSERDGLLAEDRRLEDRLSILGASLSRPDTDVTATMEAITELRDQRQALADRVEATESQERDANALRSDAVESFQDADLYGQRDLLSRYARITLKPAGGRKGVPIKDRVRVEVRQRLGDAEHWIDAI